ADLAHFRAVFEPALGTKLDVFAYPSGEFGQDASLAPGGDPNTLLGAGHSNASGLTPLLFWALRTDGFRAALAVSLPGEAHAASRQDRAYALPRLGIGATSSFASVTALHTDGFELPGITSSDRIPDFGPLAADGDGYVSAAHATPTLVRLAADGRIEQTYQLPALLADRPGRPALISALVALGGRRFAILQQAGWWPGATPQETIVADRGDRLAMLARNPLPATLNWTVGACRWNGRLVAMTDEGRIYDLVSGSLLVTIPVGADSVRHDRFAGPAVAAGNLYVYDRHRRALRIFAAAGNELASDPLGGEIRQLLGDGDLLLAVDWSDMRHIVRRFEIEP
ncbi:MAG: hypothetical protein ACREM2_10635, partial [Vulcanimicrobiaceae bacterium]